MATIQGNGIYQKDLYTYLGNIVTMCNELKADFNTLRAEYIKHDHGTGNSYATATLNSKTGGATATSTDTSDVATTDLTLSV